MFKNPNKIQITFQVTRQEHEALSEEAKSLKVSVARICRGRIFGQELAIKKASK